MTTRTISTRSDSRAVLFDITEDNMSTRTTSTTSSRSHTSSSRFRAATTSNFKSHSRHKTEKSNNATAVETADFRGTNPIMNEEILTEEVERIPTLDNRGHINFSNSRYRTAVDTAKKSVRARGALPAGSARSRDPYNVISPTRTYRTMSSEIQEEQDLVEEVDLPVNESENQVPVQDQSHFQSTRSRKQSMDARWSYCSQYPNWFLRLCTAVAIVPLTVCGLLFWPVLAAAMSTTIVLCVCSYEHAWLSFRIQKQLIATYEWYEGREDPITIENADGVSTRSNASVVCGYQDHRRRFENSFMSSQSTTATFLTHRTMIGSDDGNLTFMTNDKDSFSVEKEEMHHPKTLAMAPLLELETSRGILLGLANSLFCGNLWLTRVVVAILLTICWSVAATLAFPQLAFPVSHTPTDISAAPFYFYMVNFVASLCAVSCPDWPRAISLVVQKSAFEVLLLNTFNCPIVSSVDCSAGPITSLQTFVLGAMMVVLVHTLSARGPANLVMALTLDLIGYGYITGALGLLISMVDPSDWKAKWATIWLGMLSTMWVAQLAGYMCDAFMSRFQIRQLRLLPPRIIVSLGIEASVFAIATGSLVLVFGGAFLDVPGGVVPKVLFATASVMMARLGQLFLSLLKKASGVKWTGRLMPGFGGVLDGSHTLLFTSVVFVKYYLYVMAGQTKIDNGSGSGDSAVWATVTFSTDLTS